MNEEAEMRYLERALSEEIGGEHAPDLQERIASSAARTAPAMPPRGRTGKLSRRAPMALPARRRSPLAAIMAIMLLVVAFGAVIVGVNYTGRTPDAKESGDTAKDAPANAQKREEPKPQAEKQAPKETPENPQPGPEPEEPEEKPVVPHKPEEVEKPAPKPEEKPEQPKQPEGTEVKKPPVEPKPEEKPIQSRPAAVVAVVKDLPKKNALKLRYADTESWRAAESGEELREGVQLSASGHADVQLETGALLRFSGEVTLGAEVELLTEELYIDCIDCPEVKLRGGGQHASVNGIAVFGASRSGLSISCIQGSVSTFDGIVNGGKAATLGAKGLSKEQPTDMETLARKHAMLRATPQRVLLREDFEASAKERLDKGEIAGGVATSESKEAGVSIYFPGTFKVRAGDVVRVRYRVSRALEELVLQFGAEGKGNYRTKLPVAKLGEWVEVEFALSELVKTLDKSEKIVLGTPIKFFQLWAVAPQSVKLEVDWFEILRRPADG